MKKLMFLALIAIILASCSTPQEKSLAMQRFKGNDSENELYTRFFYEPITGIGYEKGVNRRDPSTIIKVDSLYYVWYTHCLDSIYGSTWLNADLWYATSTDGINWDEKGPAVKRGADGAWDDLSVFTCNILLAEGKYYLCYQARKKDINRNVVGMSWAESPDGPWTKLDKPILRTTPDGEMIDEHKKGFQAWQKSKTDGSWDSGACHDPGIIIHDGKYYLYYKGHQIGEKMFTDSKIGVAISDKPEGPYVKHPLNPVFNSGHEVWMFPWGTGVAAITDWAGPEKNSVQYSEDWINFERITTLEDVPPAGGAYIADKFADNKNGKGFEWGLAHYGFGDYAFLVRFDCDLMKGKEKRLGWNTFPHYSTIRDVQLNPKRFGTTSEALQGKRGDS